jgi:hypothetical protein
MTIGGGGVGLSRLPKETDPGETPGTFPRAMQEQILKAHREKYPLPKPGAEGMPVNAEEHYSAPQGYDDHADHFSNWFDAIRSRSPVTEDAIFGLRAAGPALLSNLSQQQGRILEWDPMAARMKG